MLSVARSWRGKSGPARRCRWRCWHRARVVLLGALVATATSGAPLLLDQPVLQGFNYTGGVSFSAAFFALLLGLTTYTAAFIAEIVRAGILSVNRGQREAALAVGLTSFQTLRLIVFPQALRVIIPPLTNQYLNLIKNSSLGIRDRLLRPVQRVQYDPEHQRSRAAGGTVDDADSTCRSAC